MKKSGRTISKTELVKEITRENTKYSFPEAYELINEFLERITEHCYKGDSVNLRKFGTFFSVYTRKANTTVLFPDSDHKVQIDPDQDFFTIHFKFSRTTKRQYTYNISVKDSSMQKKKHGRKPKKKQK